MTAHTLVDCDTLQRHLDDPTWRIFDCRFDLADPDAGRAAYDTGHIPGAIYVHLDDDMAGPVRADTGRHPLPARERLRALAQRWGINPGIQCVAYDDAGGAMAARLWWLLRYLGHGAAAVLDGGFSAWRGGNYPVDAQAPPTPGGSGEPDGACRAVAVDVDTLRRELNSEQALLIDARSPARYRGEEEPIDPVAGHVPGAVNRCFKDNLDDSGRFKSPERLRAEWQALLGERAPEELVHMCGSGVTACHNLLAMEHAGLGGSRLYPGSWSEWITDPQRPVARGAEEH